MANYVGMCRTNYFTVTDEEQYKKLFDRLTSDSDEVYDFTKEVDGKILHGFGSYGDIDFLDEENEDCIGIDAFYDDLQKIIPKGELFGMIQIGYEKLRYLNAYTTLITYDNVKTVSVDYEAQKVAREMLHNDKYVLNMTY